MIIKEIIELNGNIFTHTYSDERKLIRKIGTEEIYSEAYDVLEFEYEETNELIEESPEPELEAPIF